MLPAYSRVTRNDERPGVSGPLDEVGATVPGGFLTVSEQRVSGVFDFSRVGMSAHRDAAGNREGFRSSSAGAQVVVQNRSGTVVNVTYTVFAGRRASLTPQKVITIAEKLSS